MPNTHDPLLHYLASAILDNWIVTTGTIPSKHCILSKAGFTLVCFPAGLHLFGPDSLQVALPETYNWQEMLDNLLLCDICHELVTKTQRYSYAGRACSECANRQPPPDSSD